MRRFKIVVERHNDGYVDYPMGMQGAVVGQGNSINEAIEDVRSAIRFHLETFGPDAIDQDQNDEDK
jgi:predicted RNase H-like HicB family nuclease